MRGRQGGHDVRSLSAVAVAAWKGVPTAVVTKGKDVTPAAGAPKWKIVGG